LEEALSFERGEEPGGGALRQLGGLGELADSERSRAFHHAHEQLRRPVDRLGSSHNHIMEPEFHMRKLISCYDGRIAIPASTSSSRSAAEIS
jgi:hypothetical protein